MERVSTSVLLRLEVANIGSWVSNLFGIRVEYGTPTKTYYITTYHNTGIR